MIYNSDFKIVQQNTVQIDVEDMPTIEQNQSSAPQAVKVIHFEDMDDMVTTDTKTVTTQNLQTNTQTSVPQKITTNTTNYTTTQKTPVANTQYQTVKQVVPTQTKTVTTTPKTTATTTQAPVTTKTSTPQKVVTNTPQIDLQKILDNNKKYQNQPQQTTTTTTKAPVTTYTTNTPTKVVSAPVGTKTTTPTTTNTTPKVQQTKPRVQQTAPSPVKVLTPQEEEIAWQVWRSNLTNRIMQDAGSKIPNVPQGTIFKFTFDVDKYGKVTNIHTSCTNNPQYTPYAIQYIAPVIRAYQGRAILNFPEGSRRETTSYVGSFKVSNSSRYSTAGDYRDTERITK